MAWRIDEHVVRGEIDNRTRGRVVGKLWFAERGEPVELELRGDCWRDLAGRRLEFVNPTPQPGLRGNLAARQVGSVGDITASRKVKVLDFPLEDLHLYYKTGREMPWHWGNSLYLEWFSEFNGRVVIESASFELKIVGEPAWEMTNAEEETQRRANAEAVSGFLAKLGEAMAPSRELDGEEPDAEPEAATEPEAKTEADAEADKPSEVNGKPMTEAEADAMQARSDLLNDRVQARLDREGAEADYQQILQEEIERMCREYPAPEPTDEERAARAAWVEEMNRASDELLEAPAEEEDESTYEHPIADQAWALHRRTQEQAEAEDWVPADAEREHPVREVLRALQLVHVKLAAALNGRVWPPDLDLCAMTVVRLKKVREYVDDALVATESCHEENLLSPGQVGPLVVDLIELAHDVDALIAEARAKLERSVD